MKRAIALVWFAFCLGMLGNALAHRFPDSYNMVVNQIVPGACGFNSSPCIVQSLETTPVGYGSLPTCTVALTGTIKMVRDAGYFYCDATSLLADGGVVTSWVHFATGYPDGGGGGTTYTGATPIVVSGSVVSVINAGVNDAGVINVGQQQFAGPKGFAFDAGGITFSAYFTKGGSLLSGTQGVGICLGGNVNPDGVTCSSPIDNRQGAIYLDNAGVINMPASLTNTSVGHIEWNGYIYSNSYLIALTALQSVGVATGSLPTCNGGAAGEIIYDTTTTTVKWCNGTTWQAFGTGSVSSWTSNYTAQCPAADTTGCAAEEVPFYGPMRMSGGEASACRITCSSMTVGSGGSTGVVMEIYGVTEAASMCTCNLGACNLAATSPGSCNCTATLQAGRIYNLQFDTTTDCATNPVETTCNIECTH